MMPIWVGVGVIGGGGLVGGASFLLRFGVEGRSGAGESALSGSVALLEIWLDLRAFGPCAALVVLLSELFLILFLLTILLELVGSSTTVFGVRTAATLDERLKDMLRTNRESRLTL
jgi:hypothetical protein